MVNKIMTLTFETLKKRDAQIANFKYETITIDKQNPLIIYLHFKCNQ